MRLKKKAVVIMGLFGVIFLMVGLVIFFFNKAISAPKIQIMDATFSCTQSIEKFYEDDKYVYSFPCVKSKSIYVKFENGNKMLVVDALEQKKVTIDELIDAGLKVYKKEK